MLGFSHFMYGLPVWSPSLSVNLLHRIIHLHNHEVRIYMTVGLHKYDHVLHPILSLDGSLLALLFSITHLSQCISSTSALTVVKSTN